MTVFTAAWSSERVNRLRAGKLRGKCWRKSFQESTSWGTMSALGHVPAVPPTRWLLHH